MKSLSEVVKIVGLERQRIQDYENAGLAVKPSARNEYRYLLYDTPEIERLWQLRFYKECGYNIPAIKKLQAEGKLDDKEEAERIVKELKKKRDDLDNMIVIAEEMAERGFGFNELRDSFVIMDYVDSDNSFALMSAIIQACSEDNSDGWFDEDAISDEEGEEIAELVFSMLDLQHEGKSVDDAVVQDKITSVHKDLYGKLSESVIGFGIILNAFICDKEVRRLLEEEYGDDCINFLMESFRFYGEHHLSNPVDRKLMDSANNIERLAKAKYGYKSKEVQDEVGNIYGFICSIKIFTKKGGIGWLAGYSKLLNSQTFKDTFDGGRQRGILWFLSKAIEVYLESIETV